MHVQEALMNNIHVQRMHVRLIADPKLAISVSVAVCLSVNPTIDCRPVQDVPHLLLHDRCVKSRLEQKVWHFVKRIFPTEKVYLSKCQSAAFL